MLCRPPNANRRRGCLWNRGVLLTTVLALALELNPSVRASSAYQTSMDKGYVELEAAKAKTPLLDTAAKAHDLEHARVLFQEVLATYRRALEDFDAAAQADASNPAPLFFRGATLNQIGELIQQYNETLPARERGAPQSFCAAVRAINKSIELGMTSGKNPNLLVELAAAFFATGDLVKTKETVDRFLSSDVTDVSLRLRAEDLRNKAEKKILASKEPEPIHICGKTPKPVVVPGQPDSAHPTVQSQFLKSIATAVGYDGNVSHLARGIALPPGTPHKGAFFNESGLSLEGDWFFHRQVGADELVDKLAATYAAVHDAYDDFSSANSLIQKVSVGYCRAIDTKACAGLALRDTWIRDDSKTLSNLLVAQPTFVYAESPDLATQISYSLTRSDFSITPRNPLAVQDGFTHDVSIQQAWSHTLGTGSWWRQAGVTARYSHQWTGSDGIIADRQRDDVFVKTDWIVFAATDTCSFVRSVNLAASYEYRDDRYDNATFPTLTAAQRFRRHDNTNLVDVALTTKLWYDEDLKNRLEAVLEYQSTINDSNVSTKAYDQPRLIASLRVNF